MLRFFDIALGILVIFIGVLHSFLVAPQEFTGLDADALWFVAAGFAVIFAGILNVMRALQQGGPASTRLAALFATTLLLGLVSLFGVSQNALTDPGVLFQITAYALLVLFGLFRNG